MLQQVRGRMGEILWREAPVEADLVISVPDSGNPAAAGFARASGLPRDDGLIKNRYVARTFIQPGQELRKHGLRLKFNPLPEIVAGQRIVVVDDSIVRGNTTRQIVGMLRDAGASEVHLRISAPPIRHPCHYGVDMSTREEMIAHKRTVEEIADELDADSLAYLSMDGRLRGDRHAARGPLRRLLQRPLPARRPRDANGKFALEDMRRASPPAASFPAVSDSFQLVVLASGNGHQPAGDPRSRCTARRDRGGRGRLRQARRAGAGAGRGRRRRDRASSRATTTPTAIARDAAMADWIEARGADLVVLAGYMQLLSGAFVARFRNRIVNVHPALLPAFPGPRRDRPGAGGRGRDDRGHRPLRRRGGRHRAGDPPARGRGAAPAATARQLERRSTRSSTSSTRRRSA